MVGMLGVDTREDISTWWRGRTESRLLLLAGVGAVLAYTIGDVLSGLLYDGYSWADQAISELSAFGSPVRPLMVSIILTHNVLFCCSEPASCGWPTGGACGGSASYWSSVSSSSGSRPTRSGR